MKIENETQAMFAKKHGETTTNIMEPDLLAAIATLIDQKEVIYHGKPCQVKVLTVSKNDVGKWRLLFDVKNPDDTFDHVEFNVVKTGWGRGLK